MTEEEIMRPYRDALSVYFMKYGDALVKIGYSGNIPKRLVHIQSFCPLPVTLLGWMRGGPNHELALHKKFAESRSHGEWFHLTPDIAEYIATNANTWPAPVAIYPQAAMDALRYANRSRIPQSTG
jgi:hypothetical protein